MNKEFIPYEQALALKELGFDEPCFANYDDDGKLTNGNYTIKQKLIYLVDYSRINITLLAPLYQQAFRWFREKHNIDGLLHKTVEGSYYFWITECEYENYNHYKYYNQMVYFNTYEEAELACLIKLIKIVKKK